MLSHPVEVFNTVHTLGRHTLGLFLNSKRIVDEIMSKRHSGEGMLQMLRFSDVADIVAKSVADEIKSGDMSHSHLVHVPAVTIRLRSHLNLTDIVPIARKSVHTYLTLATDALGVEDSCSVPEVPRRGQSAPEAKTIES